MRQSKIAWLRLLVIALATASGAALMNGCHFHRYHHDYFIYDEFDEHPQYGNHPD